MNTPQTLFRRVAIAEVITWALLISALIARALGAPAVMVTIAGGLHGFVFLSYGATAILVAKNQRWRPGVTIVAIVSAVVPFATVPVDLWLHKRGLLAGQWRRTATDDPRDGSWHDRFMRFFLNRAWLLFGAIAVAVVALFVILLLIGPPGGARQ